MSVSCHIEPGGDAVITTSAIFSPELRAPRLQAPGPTALALAGLCSWLAQIVGCDELVEVAAPDAQRRERLCVWPVALLVDQGNRGGSRREPLRLRARYIVSAEGPIEAAIDMFDRVLVAVASQERYQLVPEPVSTTSWGSEGLPRPSVFIDVPVQIEVPAPVVSRVCSELRFDGVSVRAIHGRVLGPRNTRSGAGFAVPATSSSSSLRSPAWSR
jgi:hypothetical protein